MGNWDWRGPLAVALAALGGTGCDRFGAPPKWWWSDPIHADMYCSDGASREADCGENCGRSQDELKATVETARPGFKSCYRELLERNADAMGKLDVSFMIAPDGSVARSCVEHSTTLDDQVAAACMLIDVRELKFSKSPAYAFVRLPIDFNPKIVWLLEPYYPDFSVSSGHSSSQRRYPGNTLNPHPVSE